MDATQLVELAVMGHRQGIPGLEDELAGGGPVVDLEGVVEGGVEAQVGARPGELECAGDFAGERVSVDRSALNDPGTGNGEGNGTVKQMSRGKGGLAGLPGG